MRVLLHSQFYPNVGGIETIASLLAREWSNMKEDVTISTDIECPPKKRKDFPFKVHYQPSRSDLWGLVRNADIVLHLNVSLKAYWPVPLLHRPFAISHQACYLSDRQGNRNWRERLKLRVCKRATNIAASRAIASHIPVSCAIIPNPFDDSLFQGAPSVARDKDVAFVGRLVSDKGADLLLHSIHQLRAKGLRPQLTIVGDGPERTTLEQLSQTLGLNGQVQFLGPLTQPEVAALLKTHRILVVPSVWDEPFGVVALEGIAAGCIVIGSQGGGLKEAIGPCGLTFPNGDPRALTEKLETVLRDASTAQRLLRNAEAHLAEHKPSVVARRYLDIMLEAAR